ncbi:MAG: restriction endonuclease [bacterium]|nr:restriction endonuclease [bacterium]
MRRIHLQEHKRSPDPIRLSANERQLLRDASLSVYVDPAERDGEYYLTPGSTVGAVEVGDLSVLIEPKVGIPQLLSLACYAMGKVKHQDLRMFDFKADEALPDMLACALAAAARRAFRRGLLHGYRTEEESLYGIRGRIRFEDQLRRRFAIAMPAEVRYDEFTNDILANQLVKAAVVRLGEMQLRSQEARRGLGWVGGMMADVSWVEFPPRKVPEVIFDRLNEHYRLVVELARLILRHSAFQAERGKVRASGFLVDMNSLFQEFLTQALRDTLGVSRRVLRSESQIPFDKDKKLRLQPDFSWWDGSVCTFVGDAKYKNVEGKKNVPAGDLYQLLAYATALDLPGGLLIYAKGEAEENEYAVRHAGKRLKVASLDLSCPFEEILVQVKGLADQITDLRNEARLPRAAA